MRISDWSSDVCSSDLLAVDVRASASVDAFVAKGVAAFGRIDGAVNNAGVEGRMCALHDAGDDDYADIMDVNARGLFFAMRAEIRELAGTGGASANFGSGGSFTRLHRPRMLHESESREWR